MTYYVYKAIKKPSLSYPNNWALVSTCGDYSAARLAAEKLCPRGCKLDTEPGCDMPAAFFGSAASSSWSAMIDTKDIHRES